MNKHTIVSIINPLYNSEKFIRETINLVIDQKYSSWELLINADCSNDCSSDIVKEFSVKDARIKYFKIDYPSKAPTIPRNVGISYATRRYIAFLDSDDLWNCGKLAKQVELFASENIGGLSKALDIGLEYGNVKKEKSYSHSQFNHTSTIMGQNYIDFYYKILI